MRLYCDPESVILEVDGYAWVYSPAIHRFLKIAKSNKLAIFIVNEILANSGKIGLQSLRNRLMQLTGVSLPTRAIRNVLTGLCFPGSIFFATRSELNRAIREVKRWYDSWEEIPLYQAYLHVTHRCNYRCWYCYNRMISKQLSDELPLEKWVAIIRDLRKHGVRDFIITGGEPLLRKDIVSILRSAKDKSTNVTVLTNGSLLTRDLFTMMVPIVDHFILSLDSLSLSTQSTTRDRNGFENILNALKLFSKYAPEKLTVRSVITKTNAAELDEMQQRLEQEYGIRRYVTVEFLPNSADEINLMAKRSLKLRVEHDRSEASLDFRMFKYRCGACSSIIGVDCRGDVYPCQNFIEVEQFRICSLLDPDWYNTLLSSPVRKSFQELSVDQIEGCRSCAYRYLCGGACPAISWRVYGNLHSCPKFFCRYLRWQAKMRLINARTWKTEVSI